VTDSRIEFLYVSSVDISLPNGPGVNESQFLESCSRLFSGKFIALMPEVSNISHLNDARLAKETIYYVPRVKRRSVLSRLTLKMCTLCYGLFIVLTIRPRFIIVRADAVPVVEWILTFFSKVAVKTCEDGSHRGVQAFGSTSLTRLHNFFFRRLVRRAIMVDVVSEIARIGLLRRYPFEFGSDAKLVVIDNGADCDWFRDDISPDQEALEFRRRYKYSIGYAGNFPLERGVSELLAAAEVAPELYEDVCLIVCCGGESESNAVQFALKRSVFKDRFKLFISVPLRRLSSILVTIDVGISLRDNDGCSELKVRQYVACGCFTIFSADVNAFIEREGFGFKVNRNVPSTVNDAFLKYRSNGLQMRSNFYRYARRYLSTDDAALRRIEEIRRAVGLSL
jgi:glycosyltransferase involved in cell wall biosynthesis